MQITGHYSKTPIKDTLTQIHNLLEWKNGWNGYDSLAPNPDAILHAKNWIVQLFLEAVDVGLTWIQPNVIAEANGDVVFEWWHGKKKLRHGSNESDN